MIEVKDLPALQKLLDENPTVWNVASITEQPEVELDRWQIKQMVEGSFFVGDEVFLGWPSTGRVSSNIVTFDPETKRGITRSGRVYQLVGESKPISRDAEYVWNTYKRINRLTELTKSVKE